MSFQSWLDILRCPACAPNQGQDPGRLDLVADRWLVCQDCGRKYPIRDQVPAMLIEEGTRHQRTPVEELVDRPLPGTTGEVGERAT